MWTYSSSEASADSATVILTLRDSPETLALWPHQFALRYRITLGSQVLTTELTAINSGDSPFKCQMLLHTYHNVPEVTDIFVDSFMGCLCYDQLTKEDAKAETQHRGVIDREVDKIYLQKDSSFASIPVPLTLCDAERSIKIYKGASKSEAEVPVDVVFWNPWVEKAKSLADLPDDAYHKFVCIEPGIVQDWVTLESGESLTLWQTLEDVRG